MEVRDWWTGNEPPPHIKAMIDLMKSWRKKKRRRTPKAPTATPPNG